MEKKNPYVMTIGFRRNNADHTRVAEFLNSLGVSAKYSRG